MERTNRKAPTGLGRVGASLDARGRGDSNPGSRLAALAVAEVPKGGFVVPQYGIGYPDIIACPGGSGKLTRCKMDASGQLIRLILRRHAVMRLDAKETLLLMHLADAGMEVRARQKDLAGQMGTSARQVSRCVASLVARGLLEVKPAYRRSGGRAENIYDLIPFVMACGER